MSTASQAEAVKRLVRESVATVDALAPEAMRALMPALVQARDELRRDLERWLANAPGGSERFTAYQRAQALRALEGSLERIEQVEPAMASALGVGRAAVGPLAVGNLDTEITRLSSIFGGGVPTLPQINTAAVIAKGDRLLWKRHTTSARRYAGGLGDDIRHQFAVALAKGETFAQMQRRITGNAAFRNVVAASDPNAVAAMMSEGLLHKWRHWGDRLVRTENMHAYNVQHDVAIEHVNANRQEGEDEYLRKWDASADRVTCPRCKELHGTTATLEGTFKWGIKSPPLHPYCRCVVLAWLERWGNMKGEQKARNADGSEREPKPDKLPEVQREKKPSQQGGKLPPLVYTPPVDGRSLADFGLVDERGRQLGGIATVRPTDGGYRASVQAARDGQKFGAIPRGGSATFTTQAEADEFVRRKVAAQQARYAKAAGVTVRPEGMRPATLQAAHGSAPRAATSRIAITEREWKVPEGRTEPRKYLEHGKDRVWITDRSATDSAKPFRVESKGGRNNRAFATVDEAQAYARQQLEHKAGMTSARDARKLEKQPPAPKPAPAPTPTPPTEPPAIPKERKNEKRVAAARKAAEASAERRREIHSAAKSNLPQELHVAWDQEGHKFMREEAGRIKGVKDRVNASSTLSQAFAEKYGSGAETAFGNEGDRFYKRAEIEAKHAESWADEQERKYYAAAQREHDEGGGARGRSRATPQQWSKPNDDDEVPF